MMIEKNKKSNKKRENFEESGNLLNDKVKILFALGVTEPKAAKDCPAGEKLAALVDGRLEEQERNIILEHLNACSSCYRKWLDISAIKKEKAEKNIPATKALKKRIYWSSGFSIAVAACLVLVLWRVVLHPPEAANMLKLSYRAALMNEMSLKNVQPDRIPKLPWESERTRGGQPSQPESLASRAFASGFTSGRGELLEEHDKGYKVDKKWEKTPLAPYFFLGRWCILIQSVCQSGKDIPTSFWEQQRDFLDSMEKMLPQQVNANPAFEIELVRKALNQLKTSLNTELQQYSNNKSTCQHIEPEIEAIKASLS